MVELIVMFLVLAGFILLIFHFSAHDEGMAGTISFWIIQVSKWIVLALLVVLLIGILLGGIYLTSR